MHRLIMGIICSFIVTTSLADTRDRIVEEYISSLSHGQYQNAAKTIRSTDLEDYKNLFMMLLRAEADSGKRDFLEAMFGHEATLQDAFNAPADVVFSSTMNLMMGLSKQMDMKLEFMPPKILGEIKENEGLVHVIARTTVKLGDTASSKVEVISMTLEGDTWKIVLPEQTKAMGQVLLKQLNMR